MRTEAFKKTLMSLQPNLLSFAITLTSNRDDAYDLLQDTTLQALDNEDKYTDNTNFKGWVFTIMRNLFINNYRRAMRSAVVIDHSDDLYMLDVSGDSGIDDPEEAMSTKEITAVLRSYEDEVRVPFSMFLAGYKYQEIAKQLGLPLGTVKSRIYIARHRLRDALRDYRN